MTRRHDTRLPPVLARLADVNAAVGEPLQHARVARARVVGSTSNASSMRSASARSMPVLGLVTVKITSSFVVSTPYSKNGQHTRSQRARSSICSRAPALAWNGRCCFGTSTAARRAPGRAASPLLP